MSFRDYNDEGPGTFEWDFVLGGSRFKAALNKKYKQSRDCYVVDLTEI